MRVLDVADRPLRPRGGVVDLVSQPLRAEFRQDACGASIPSA
jgi:hypothetical protein